MIEPAAIPLPRAQKSPEAAYVIKNNIFEVHQYRETDTTENNQQGYVYIKRIMMPRQQQRIAQIARQGGETGIAERRYGMESRESQFLVYVHAHRAMNITPNGEHPRPLYRQREAEDIDQRGEQRVQRVGADHIAHHQLIVQRSIAHEEHCEEARQRHHPQTANLNQQDDDYEPRCRKGGRHIHRGQPRHTHRTCGDEQRIDPRDARHRRTGKHQQSRPHQYYDKEADSQNERRVCPPPQQPHQAIGQIKERKHQQQ